MFTFDFFVHEHTSDGWKVSAWCEQEEVAIETEIKFYTFIEYVADWYDKNRVEAIKLYGNMDVSEERMFLEILFIRRFNEKIPA